MKILAPGKIILSGEHAVVYGSPALAVAVNRHTHTHFEHNESGLVHLKLPDLNFEQTRSVSDIQNLHQHLDTCFAQRMDNSTPKTTPLLSNPGDLYFYGISHFLTQNGIHQGSLTITLTSDIPLGSGMGSSASTLSALYLGLHEYFSIPFDKNTLALQVAHTERLQHACISRIDSNVTIHGGFIRFNDNSISHLDIVMDDRWRLIYTGTPSSSTGECVAQVRINFSESNIWSEFKAVTCQFEQALLKKDHLSISHCVADNQQLLQKIGVVPQKISAFIKQLYNQCGITAKISGAGSIRGDNAGLLLAHISDNEAAEKELATLCEHYNYPQYRLNTDQYGARRCD